MPPRRLRARCCHAGNLWGTTSMSLKKRDSARLFCGTKKNPAAGAAGFWIKTLAMTYSRMLDAHYHRRVRVSLPSSGWDRVVPRSYCHQGEGGGSQGRTDPARTLSLVCLGRTDEPAALANRKGRSESCWNVDASSMPKPLEVIWSSHTDH